MNANFTSSPTEEVGSSSWGVFYVRDNKHSYSTLHKC